MAVGDFSTELSRGTTYALASRSARKLLIAVGRWCGEEAYLGS